jgi:Flp pilus assembly protein TadG
MVEFALVAMVLVMLVTVIIDAAWLLFSLGTLAGAAREAARDFAIHNNQTSAKGKAVAAAGGTGLTEGEITIVPASCSDGATVTVTIVRVQPTITRFLLPSVPLRATGAMRCNG